MISVRRWDREIPSSKGEIVSFEFIDPDVPFTPTEDGYCVGLKYQGGDRSNPKNWTYDHTNYWSSSKEPREITLPELEAVLEKYDTTLRDLCDEFIRLAFPKESRESTETPRGRRR